MDETNLEKSSRLFAHLLEHGELSMKRGTSDLYSYYDIEEVRAILSVITRGSKLVIEKVKDTIYMVPAIDNNFLGYSKADIKQKFLQNDTGDEGYYLVMFIILNIIQKFYSSVTGEAIANSQSIGEMIELVDKKLASLQGVDESVIELSVRSMTERWINLRVSAPKSKGTKTWFVERAVKILDVNKLVNYKDTDKRIYRTERLDNLIHGFLTTRRYKEMQEYIAKEKI
jgi:hypothetical protein